jgi:predicted transcriptional regulator
MPDSMAEQLQAEMECENLLECFHGLTDLDGECFQALVDSAERLTVDELADEVGRERSTAYRSAHRLVDAGFARKHRENNENGGCYHVYRAADPDVVADDLQRMLDDWYEQSDSLIDEFRGKYGGN